MNKSTIESELKEILSTTSKESSLLKLQRILSVKETASLIYTIPSTREIINAISAELKPSLLPTSLYHLIQTTAAKIQCELITGGRVRSLLDIQGNILWTESTSSKIFGISNETLCRSNVFNLMSKLSTNHLYLKYGDYLLWPKRTRIITYMMKDSNVVLTSRCTPAIFKKNPGEQNMVIVMETRQARHSLLTRSNTFGANSPFKADVPFSPYGIDFQIGVFSPQTPNLDCKGIFSPPTTIPSEERGFEPLEKLRITPFLEKSESSSPYKKRKIENIQISEF
jgi:hypothetical protein